MDVLLIRHGVAKDREHFAASGRPDEERPLTRAGRRKLANAVRGLASLVVAPDLVLTSPWLRAKQTASLVAEAFGLEPQPPLAALAGDRHPREALAWLNERWSRLAPHATVALIGHEPQLGRLLALCVTGTETSFAVLGKAGACLLRFDEAPARGGARLRWLLRPRQLRALARNQ